MAEFSEELKQTLPITKSEIQANAIQAVLMERDYQDRLWGAINDRTTTEDEWLRIISEYSTGNCVRAKGYNFRTRMIKTAAIALAAIEAIDSKV